MTLDQLGNVGELIGAIAVIASLAYLGVQIRQNTRAVRSSAHQGLVNALDSLVLRLSDSSELAQIWVKAHDDEASLTRVEEVRFTSYANRVFGSWENVYFQRQQGLVSSDMWEAWVTGFRRIADAPPLVRHWKASKEQFLPAFQEHVEATLPSTRESA